MSSTWTCACSTTRNASSREGRFRTMLTGAMCVHRSNGPAMANQLRFYIAATGACLGLACGDHEGPGASLPSSTTAGGVGTTAGSVGTGLGGAGGSSGGARPTSPTAGGSSTQGTSVVGSVIAGGASSVPNPSAGGSPSSSLPSTTSIHEGGAASGAGGAGGVAGTTPGSAGEATVPYPCDDANPCTLDQGTRSTGCIYVPVADGSSCDDGNGCTDQDRCSSGVCAGSPFAAEAEVLGSVHVFGRGPALPGWVGGHARVRGVAGFLSESRVVFVDESTRQSQVSLVEVGSSGLRRLDSTTTSHWVTGTNISGWVWTYQPGTDIVPLSPTRFALFGGGLEVYDTIGDRLQLLWRASPWTDGLAAVGRDDRLFVCTEFGARVYRIEASGEPILEQELSSVGVGYCISLSLSEDGNTLYAAGIGGAQSFQLSPAGAAPVKQQDLSPRATYRVLSNSAFLVRQAIQASMGWGDVSVYRADDLTSTI